MRPLIAMNDEASLLCFLLRMGKEDLRKLIGNQIMQTSHLANRRQGDRGTNVTLINTNQGTSSSNYCDSGMWSFLSLFFYFQGYCACLNRPCQENCNFPYIRQPLLMVFKWEVIYSICIYVIVPKNFRGKSPLIFLSRLYWSEYYWFSKSLAELN